MSEKSRARATAQLTGRAALSPQPTTALARRDSFWASAIIVLAAIAVYQNSFSGPFILDDPSAIADNPTIRHLASALSPPQDAAVGGRPLLNLSFALNYAMSGMNVRGYHAFNLLIHTLAGLTLFGVVRRTLLERPTAKSNHTPHQSRGTIAQGLSPAEAKALALAVAVIWVVHPLQTEAVTYISQRAESLMGLLYLLTVYCFIRGIENCRFDFTPDASGINHDLQSGRGKPSHDQSRTELQPLISGLWLLASIGCCLLGVMSKEIIVTAPVMVFLYDRTFVAGSFREAWQRRWRYYLGLASTWILLACLMANLHERSVGFGQGVSWWTYALTSCRSVVLYLKLAIWPHPLVFDYGTHVVQHVAEVVPHALILAALLAGVGILLRYRPALGFAGAWFFLILAPSSSVVPITQQPMAEHRMYLPLAAIIALAVLGLNSWIKRGRLILFAALAVELGCLSVRRNEDYRSALAIWTDTSAKLPGNARAHANLGSVLVDIPGRLSEAISHYDEALRINPDYALAHCDLGVALTKIPGRQTDAIAQFETALRINPGFADAHCDLGAALANIPGRQSEAILHYEAALRIQPDNAKIHDNLGMALSTFPDRMPEAISEYEAALRIEPGLAEVHYHLGTALAQTGNLNGGIAQLEEAVRIRPDYAAADNDLGAALIQAQQYPEAIDRLEHALDLEPNYLGAHNNLGIALLRVGRLPDAADQFNAALKLDPDFSMARINLARAFALMNRLPEARHEVETVLQTNANDESAAAARKVLAQLQLIDNRPASTH